jgi:hypothetical protein
MHAGNQFPTEQSHPTLGTLSAFTSITNVSRKPGGKHRLLKRRQNPDPVDHPVHQHRSGHFAVEDERIGSATREKTYGVVPERMKDGGSFILSDPDDSPPVGRVRFLVHHSSGH